MRALEKQNKERSRTVFNQQMQKFVTLMEIH
jgi:hypothetical protein